MPESGKVELSESETQFTLNCFGRFTLLRGGVPAEVDREKARELLSFLACEGGRPVLKRTAAQALWPGRAENQSMDSLYKVCRYLEERARRGEAPGIRAVQGRLWLEMERVDCDLAVFRGLTGPKASLEELRRAVELYRGPLLVEEGYEWTDAWEGFYDLRYLDALERLRSGLSALGRREEAERYARLLRL